MLTGDPPFTGSTAQAIVAKVVTEKPVPPSRLRDTVPPAVEDAVLTALAKLPADRFASAAAFAAALTAPVSATRPMPSAARGLPASWIQRHAVPIVAVLALATLAAGAMALRHRSRPGDDAVNRFTLALESGTGVSNATGGNRFAWAPDGRSFVYVGPGAGGTTQLWLRSLDALGPTPITGTEGASSPFFSPDGRQVGFMLTNPFAIRLIAREGGTSVAVATDSVSGGGVDWGADGWLYFDAGTSIDRIRPDGTGRQMVTPLDTLRHETGVAWPQLLPGNGAVIFRARSLGEDVSEYRIQAVDLGTHRRKELVRATYARYVAPGYLLYVLSDGTLMASRFDVKRVELTGTPVAIARGLSIVAFGAADLAVSTTGSLLYTVGRGITTAEPVWVGRDGAVTPVDPAWRAVYASGLALSPDGTRLAVSLYATDFGSTSRTEDIWVKQLPAGPLSRLTFEGEQNRRPAWSPDGRDILFLSSRSGPSTLYRQRADGSAPAVRIGGTLPSVPLLIGEGLEAPDGRIILRTELLTAGNGDILVMNQGDTLAKPALASPFQELSPAISPDGHWLAFTSNETGRSEVYVRPFPDVQAGKYQVSTAGGLTPRWSHGGKELFYRSMAEDFMAAEVRTTPGFAVVAQKRLFSSAGFIGTPGHAIFDLAPDDSRFLMLRTGSPNGGPEETVQLILVQNFDAELRRLLH
jgi:eukaryotic-like serine/threonine-protein kinase